MSFNIGVMNAAVVLDDSDPNAKLKQFPVTAENSFKKVAGYAAMYLSARALWSFGGEAGRILTRKCKEVTSFMIANWYLIGTGGKGCRLRQFDRRSEVEINQAAGAVNTAGRM